MTIIEDSPGSDCRREEILCASQERVLLAKFYIEELRPEKGCRRMSGGEAIEARRIRTQPSYAILHQLHDAHRAKSSNAICREHLYGRSASPRYSGKVHRELHRKWGVLQHIVIATAKGRADR